MTDLRAYQPSFTGGEISPALWARTDLAKYATALKQTSNLFIHPHGGVSNRAGLQFLGEAKIGASAIRLIPFQFNTEQSYVLEFGSQYMRVWKGGALVLAGSVPYSLVTNYLAPDLADLVVTQEADVMFITHVNYPPMKLSRFADNNWTLAAPSFVPIQQPPSGIGSYVGTGSGSTSYEYVVSAVSAASGEESLISNNTIVNNNLAVAGNFNVITIPGVAGAGRYIVYKKDGGVYGYIGGTEGSSFIDDNITADTSDTPQKGYNPFQGAGNYPRCSTFVDQRLAFASTLNQPQACWFSQTGNYENFGFSRPRKASDGFEFRIRSRQVNEIRSLLQSRGLMVLTSGGEFVVSGGQDEYLAPDTIVVKNQGYRGCSRVQPVVVGNTVLFAQQRGGVIRDFSYEFSEDTFTGKDLTILARHLFERREIKAMAYAQAPYSIVWVVMTDGSLVSLTYIKEHDVWAWTQHKTDGLFEDVTVIGEGSEDVPYFVIRRTIGGVQKRYIERLHTREFTAIEDAFFVDCGLTYTGAAATIISGLSHLEGRSVVALADGNVVQNLTVTAGAVTLPNPAAKVHIGLSYEAMLKTLDIDMGQVRGLGTVQGRQKSVAEVTFRVERTRGIWLGNEDGARGSAKMVEWKQRGAEAWDAAIQPFTGDFTMTPMWDWSTGGNVVVKQFDPLPMTLLAIMPDMALGK